MAVTGSRSRPPRVDREASDGRPLRHQQAVVQAEARRLARSLAPYGVLPRDTLQRVAGATRWSEGGFERALSAAVRVGLIERLPSGFYSRRGSRRRGVAPPAGG